MKQLRTRKKLHRGFGLIEVLVVLVVMALLALLASTAFDGSRSKAQTMLALGKQLGEANVMLKLDTGCFVKKPQALFDPAAAQVPANNYCNRTFDRSWNRPYMAKYPVDNNGGVLLDKIGAEVVASFPDAPEVAAVGGTSWKRYYVSFANVPADVIRQALLECNGNDSAQGDFGNDKCRTTAELNSETPGRFDVLFDETR